MKKLIAVLMVAAFAGTTFNVAAQTPATPATPAQSATPAAPAKGGKQEDRQVGRQEKGQGQKQEGRIQELKQHRPLGPRKTKKAGPPAFFFCGTAFRLKRYNRGPEPGGTGLNSRGPTPPCR